jgi:signal transduction histidine kinase
MSADALSAVLAWLEATLTIQGLSEEVEHGTRRISALVKAVKEYTYMDQAPLQEIDIHEGLESTLIIFDHKLKHGIVVTREYDRSLPRICAYGSELNQVWTNLLDNAIDALQGQGQIWVRTASENDHILVEIADNGPGIPLEIQHRVFEPFFTTKGVGKGTGLGLDISYRIVGKHHGDIRVISTPGDTRFQIRLPIDPENK